MTYPDFEARWKPAGGAERANYSLFLQDLCDLIGVARPDPTTDNPTQDAYVLERAVEFNDHGKRSIGRIDLYKRGCFVLETKQGTETPDQQKAYTNRVPDSADLVMYWWDTAALALRIGITERFGFITTNSLTQIFNRRVLQRHMEAEENPLSLSFAIPNHPWVDSSDGAAVRVAMTVAQSNQQTGTLQRVIKEWMVDGEEEPEVTIVEVTGEINSDLSVGADLSSAIVLKANEGMSFQGVKLVGAGFLLSEPEGLRIQSLSNENVIRPYRTGKDLTTRSRNVMVIDLFGLSENEVFSRHPELYQHLLQTVKPERDQVQRAAHRERWWIHGEAVLCSVVQFIA